MCEFKINLIFKKEEITFQLVMNELFLQYLKNKTNPSQGRDLSYIQ